MDLVVNKRFLDEGADAITRKPSSCFIPHPTETTKNNVGSGEFGKIIASSNLLRNKTRTFEIGIVVWRDWTLWPNAFEAVVGVLNSISGLSDVQVFLFNFSPDEEPVQTFAETLANAFTFL